MRVLVTGVAGQLGHDVVARLTQLSIENRGVDAADFDLTDASAVSDAILSYAPDCVVHCAAFTNVDRAETERELCYAVNVTGTESVARACKALHAKMIYISTDFVFDGGGEEPFAVDSPRAPVNHYGETKSLGEDRVRALIDEHFIVRTAWVFGKNGGNFVRTMLRLGAEREELRVVRDQVGSPTYTPDLARLLCDMLQTERYGTYHATNEGYCSKFAFAREIFAQSGLACRALPVLTEEFPSPAARPGNSRLDKSSLDRAGFSRLPDWRDALRRYLLELQDQQ